MRRPVVSWRIEASIAANRHKVVIIGSFSLISVIYFIISREMFLIALIQSIDDTN
jgi:hypothetical protein